MSMQRQGGRGTGASPFQSCWRGVVAALICGAAVTGCSGIGANMVPTQARGTSIAFESIDGLPPELARSLLRDLKEEAAARQIAVVAGGEASFRIRGYLAVNPARGSNTAIAWAWDIYDAKLARAFRLGGEETGAATDESVLRRIARAGMDQFTAFMASPPPASPAPVAPPPARNGAAVASLETAPAR
jgi:hypothetical protein